MPNNDGSVKKSVDLTFFARLLISIAIVLLVYGFYLDVGDSTRLIDPVALGESDVNSGNTTTIDIYHWGDVTNPTDIDESPIDGKNTDSTGKTGSSSSTGKTGKTGSS